MSLEINLVTFFCVLACGLKESKEIRNLKDSGLCLHRGTEKNESNHRKQPSEHLHFVKSPICSINVIEPTESTSLSPTATCEFTTQSSSSGNLREGGTRHKTSSTQESKRNLATSITSSGISVKSTPSSMWSTSTQVSV